MLFNVTCAKALVENSSCRLEQKWDLLVQGLPDADSLPGFVEKTFKGLFFLDSENRFIDQILSKILKLHNYEQALAFYALFQASLAKRPYNLFHRANLYMRTNDVKRTFGNKTTWDRPFAGQIKKYGKMADKAIFDTALQCKAVHRPLNSFFSQKFDLVYLDPPYISKNKSKVDYMDYYHFLEGLCNPGEWAENILHRYKHKPLKGKGESPWSDPSEITTAFKETIEGFADSKIVISYRSDGIPSINEIASFLKRVKKRVKITDAGRYTYALSNNKSSVEIILTGV
jgi:adenine-specific DNA methylase